MLVDWLSGGFLGRNELGLGRWAAVVFAAGSVSRHVAVGSVNIFGPVTHLGSLAPEGACWAVLKVWDAVIAPVVLCVAKRGEKIIINISINLIG